MQLQIMLQQKKRKKTTKFLAVLGLCLTLAVCLCSSIAKTSVTPQQADVQVVQIMNSPMTSTRPGYVSLRLADSSTEAPAKKAASPILTEIIENLTGGITSTAQGIGTGINSAIKSIFIDSTGSASTLSTAGIIITVFAGIALALGLTYLVVHFLFNLGGGRL